MRVWRKSLNIPKIPPSTINPPTTLQQQANWASHLAKTPWVPSVKNDYSKFLLFWLFYRVNSKPTNQRSSFCSCFGCNWEFGGIFLNFNFFFQEAWVATLRVKWRTQILFNWVCHVPYLIVPQPKVLIRQRRLKKLLLLLMEKKTQRKRCLDLSKMPFLGAEAPRRQTCFFDSFKEIHNYYSKIIEF